jgi:glycosyltransferase involved in cell wall biosynthesis
MGASIALKLAVIIPCLNEDRSIATVISKIPKEFEGIDSTQVIVVDDGSTDETAKLAAGAGALVKSHPHNMGLGIAFRTGIEAALGCGADVIVNMDGDGQFDPEDIHKLIAPVVEGRAEFVTASRFKDRALIPVMPGVKKWGNHRIAQLVSVLVGQRFYDVSCGFRAYSREAVMHLTLMGRYTYTQETFLEMAFRGFRILEIPTRVRGEREFGKSRIASSIWRYAKNTSAIILRSYRDYKPFTFFGVPACGCILTALALLGFFFAHYLRTGRFSGHLWAGFTGGGFLIVGLMLILLAVVTDMLVRIRRNQEELLYFEKSARYSKKADKEDT